MTLRYSFQTALTGLKTHKSRSALTIAGIVIGITAVILMMAIGKGAEELIVRQLGGLGAETIVIRPGREPKGPTDLPATLFADSLKQRDVEALKKKSNVPDLVEIMPVVFVPGSIAYEGETFRPTILGGNEADFFSNAFNIFPEEGSFFDQNDVLQRAKVVMIGSKIKKELFGESDALGKYVQIKNDRFRVVAVLQTKGQVSFLNVNELAIVPYSTAQAYLLGIDHFHEIIVKTARPDAVPRTVRDIEVTLRESHGITDPDKDDFFVVTQQGVVDQVRTILGAVTIFLSLVVAIALVVGGVGVMNIMLVSVTERTREIGLRKAVGATDRDILTQFLLEAVILTGTGGVIGILLGFLLSIGAAFAITYYAQLPWPFAFPISAAILGFIVSTLVGLIFGLYPARQASLKSPIEALRYE